jgi:adenine-specific DNA-methyltransferase
MRSSKATCRSDPETLPFAELRTISCDDSVDSEPIELTASQRRKKFGQVFTPPTLAALMADWVMKANPSTVLDPAFGQGALAGACLDLDRSVKFVGYEIDPIVLEGVPTQVREAASIKLEDFLRAPVDGAFSGIIANPPYIRHRELRGHLDQRSELARISGCSIPKSANQYVDFLVKATLHLNRGGRAAFLIPAEWMSANFARGLKRYLLDGNFLHSIVTFSNCSDVFHDALTTASVVLIENTPTRVDTVTSYYLYTIEASTAPRSLEQLRSMCQPKRLSAGLLRDAPKWEPILRGDQSSLPEGWITLGEIASTMRGIATGSNEFFLISEERRVATQIDPAHVVPCVGRSNDVRGVIFAEDDFNALKAKNAKVWLLNFSPKLSATERAYVLEGEANGVHTRFLTKTRRPWFTMEQRTPAPIWAGVFGRGDLRFVYNEAQARSLTNFHCVYPRLGGPKFHRALVAVLNSTSVRNLMVSHQRSYGGGLMKFEPKDLLSIPIPDLRRASQDSVDDLADQLNLMHRREFDSTNVSPDRVDEIIASISNAVIKDGFQLVEESAT